MRVILTLALLSGLALAGCKSEEQKKADFRQQFMSQCAQAVRSQPSAPPGLNADTVCTCVSDRIFAGKSSAEIEKVVNEETGVTQATTECVVQQLQQAGAAQSPAAMAPAAGTPETEAVAESVVEAADDAE